MKLIPLLALFSLLVTTATGQVSSPAGYLSTEGASRSGAIGNHTRGKVMFLDSGFRGQPLVIHEIAWRRDEGSGSLSARSWTQVEVVYAPCDASITHSEFSRVAVSTPTRVFAGPVTWPAISGPPTTQPAPWGGSHGNLRTPFTQQIVTTGNHDLSFQFSWTGGTSQPTVYRTDAASTTGLRFGQEDYYGNRMLNGCANGGRGLAGDLIGSCVTHSKDFTNTATRDTVEFAMFTHNTTASMPVAHVICLGGSATGVPFAGLTCNKLHLDLSLPHDFGFPTAAGNGFASTAIRVPFRPGLIGLPMWMQAGWEEPSTRRLLLTNAVRVLVPSQPPIRTRTMFSATSLTAQFGTLRSSDSAWNPLFRYGR